MSIVNTTECIICYNEYDTDSRKPCIGTCGHSICERCKHQMVSTKCPQCSRKEAFAITTINYQVLELIKHFKSMKASGSSSGQSLVDDGLDKGTCCECSLRTRKLRLCIPCAVKAGILKHDGMKKEFVLNIENDDVGAALQRAKGIAICADCALDGVKHKGHEILQLAVLRNNLEGRIQENAESQWKKLIDKFKGAFNSLKKYFDRFHQLPASERQIQFNNIETILEKLNDTISEVKHDGHSAQQCTVLQSNIEDRDTTSLKERIDQLQNNGGQTVLDLQNTFADTVEILKNKRVECNASPTEERKKDLKVFEEKFEHILNNLSSITKEFDISHLVDPVLVADTWTPVDTIPNPKSHFAVASNKSQIFIVGGMVNGSWLREVELYDKNAKLRKNCAPMKRGRARGSAGFHNNKMYVVGGYNSDYMSFVEVFDPDHETWKDGPSLQRPRADGAVVSCNGELFVLGGFNGNNYEEKIEKLMEQTQKFEIAGEMQGSRAGFGACEFRGRIYIAGGWNSSCDMLKSVRSYDPITNSWRDEPSMNIARKYFTLRATSNSIYAIRGCPDNSSEVNVVEKFDVEGQKWDLVQQVSK